MVSSNRGSSVEEDTPAGVDIFYLVIKRKGSDDVIFEHRFDSSTTMKIPPQRLRIAVRTLSVEIAPSETDCQIVKRGDLPIMLVWSSHLGAIAAVTQYTAALHTSCQQILEFFETKYPDVVEEGGDLSGHVPIVEQIKEVLRPALLRENMPPPPPVRTLIETPGYYFSATEDQVEQFTSIHAASKGFQGLLERETLEREQIAQIMTRLKNNVVVLNELSEQFKITPEKLARVLRHLHIFELVSLFSTPL